MGGYFWEMPAPYYQRSPIMRVNHIHTPVLLQYGEKDPKSQGIELYGALKALGIPVTMLIYPNTEHAISTPQLMMESARINLRWIAKYLKK